MFNFLCKSYQLVVLVSQSLTFSHQSQTETQIGLHQGKAAAELHEEDQEQLHPWF